MVNQIDFTASFAELLEVELAKDEAIDSRSTLAAFLGKSEQGQEVMLEEARTLAIRQGDWKLIKGIKWKKQKKASPDELYNLGSDIGEKKNLAKENPDKAAELAALLEKMRSAEGGIRALE